MTTLLPYATTGRRTAALRILPKVAFLILVGVVAQPAGAQRVVKQPEQVLSVAKGASALLVNPVQLQRFSIGDPSVAEAVIISPTEVLINGKTLGTTTLLLWDNQGIVRLYSIEVTADAPGLERYLQTVIPGEQISVTASGNTVTLSGTVRDASVAGRAVEIAKNSGAMVVDNLSLPTATQVLLQVRFAEVNRNALSQFASQLATLNPHKLDDDGDWKGSTNSSDGLITLSLLNPNASIEGIFRALKARGEFKSLAEPNLLTLPGKEAYFLAGGEFPYPSVQAGQAQNTVTIVFKEFGIKLRFTPTIMRNGSIRLKVLPEVSSLDFANALTIAGFVVPSLLTRKAETEVELREGQHLAIAGLLDNTTIKNVSKIPVLGDIPILGQFFRSSNARQQRTELLVVVTPLLVQAQDSAPALPTGEPEAWKWDKSLKYPPKKAAGVRRD